MNESPQPPESASRLPLVVGMPMSVQLRWSTWNEFCDLTGGLIDAFNQAAYITQYDLVLDACGEPGPDYIKVTIPAQLTSTGRTIDPQIALHGDWIRRDAAGLIHVDPLRRRCPTCLRTTTVTATQTPGLVKSDIGLTLTTDHAVRLLECADEWHVRKPFAFEWSHPDTGPAEQLYEAVFTAIGAASVAWDRVPEGIFDSTLAREIGEALLDVIRSQQFLLTEAIRLTREYVDPASAASTTDCMLPALPGWSWYDAWHAVDPAGLHAYLHPPTATVEDALVNGIPFDSTDITPRPVDEPYLPKSCTCGELSKPSHVVPGRSGVALIADALDVPVLDRGPHGVERSIVFTHVAGAVLTVPRHVPFGGGGMLMCTILEALEALDVPTMTWDGAVASAHPIIQWVLSSGARATANWDDQIAPAIIVRQVVGSVQLPTVRLEPGQSLSLRDGVFSVVQVPHVH